MSGNLPPPDPTALPKYDFANKGTLTGLLKQFQKLMLQNTEDMLPATLISYNRTSNIATVQPSIHMVTTDGTLVGRASIASVPVLCLGGGGFFVSFPLVAGAKGWIKASDRDISLFVQSTVASAPNTQRMHSFSDGLFIPDIIFGSQYTINGADENSMVIQNLTGTVKIALAPNTINITAPTVNVNSTTTNLNGALVINGTPFLNYRATGVQSGSSDGTGLIP